MRNLGIWMYALAVLLVAAALRVWNVLYESPGYEEMVIAFAARSGVAGYLGHDQVHQCPPVLYLLLHPFTWRWPELPLAALRLPSVVAGAGACAAVYLLGRPLLPRGTAAVAALLLAVNPLHIHFSKDAQPVALLTLLCAAVFFQLLRSARSGRLRDWLLYDLLAVMMLHSHSEAVFIAEGFLLIHLLKGVAFREPHEQGRTRRARYAGMVALNYLVIAACSLPWLVFMQARIPWDEPRPTILHLVRIIGSTFNFGLLDPVPAFWHAALALVLIVLVPPAIKVFRQGGFALYALTLSLFFTLAIPFLYSVSGRIRFIPATNAAIALPFFLLLLATAVCRCKVYMRTAILCVLLGVYASASVHEALSQHKLDWRRIARTVREKASPNDLLVFWPDFTTAAGKYMFGDSPRQMPASEFFDRSATPPSGTNTFFLISQYPSKNVHLYTFPGALYQYSRSSDRLWQDKLNMVVSASDLDMFNLALWYRQPQTLNVIDTPTTDITQFIFTPADKIYRTKDFHWDEPDLAHDLDGRRYVWTSSALTDLKLPLTLSPGVYMLKVHCASDFEHHETGFLRRRTINLNIRTGEERKVIMLDKELTVSLPFSVDHEIHQLPLHIEATPTLKFGGRQFALKLYSISIDLTGEVGAP